MPVYKSVCLLITFLLYSIENDSNKVHVILFYLLQVSRAMELKGHTAGVYHFSFSADSTR